MRGGNGVPQYVTVRPYFHRSDIWPSMSSSISQESRKSKYLCEAFKGVILTEAQESSENSPSSLASTVHKKQAKLIKVDGGDSIQSVAFLVDGKHIVGGGTEGKIRCWRVKDGALMGTMDAGSHIWDIAVSRDGKWVVGGTTNGLVIVWNAASYEKVIAFAAHKWSVRAVDVSPDGTRIVTGSEDSTACVWSLSNGQRLLGPLKHSLGVVSANFSPNGRLIATFAWNCDDRVRIYDSQDGRPLVDVEIQASTVPNQSLAWTSDSMNLFVLSMDGSINCLDVSTGTTRSKWPIHASHDPTCIALASNGTFIAASAYPSVSLWDTTTHQQIGFITMDRAFVESIAISANYVLAMGEGDTITLRSLWDVLPPSYSNPVSAFASEFGCARLFPNHESLC